MATKTTETICRPIEYWRDKLAVQSAIHAGATAQQGWLQGKAVPETEYKAALAKFLNGAMSGTEKGGVSNA